METEKKTPEEEKKADAPAAEQKDEPKPEEKPAENKQADDNGTAREAATSASQTTVTSGLCCCLWQSEAGCSTLTAVILWGSTQRGLQRYQSRFLPRRYGNSESLKKSNGLWSAR